MAAAAAVAAVHTYFPLLVLGMSCHVITRFLRHAFQVALSSPPRRCDRAGCCPCGTVELTLGASRINCVLGDAFFPSSGCSGRPFCPRHATHYSYANVCGQENDKCTKKCRESGLRRPTKKQKTQKIDNKRTCLPGRVEGSIFRIVHVSTSVAVYGSV